MTVDEGVDEDGDEQNAVRRRAYELLSRSEADLTDAELFSRQASADYWFAKMCISEMHRLPSEVEPRMLCSEYTLLQAVNIIDAAMADMRRRFSNGA